MYKRSKDDRKEVNKMYVRYVASIAKGDNNKSTWAGDSDDVFTNVSHSSYYIKEIYFYPSKPPESVRLWVLGHEKSLPNKAIVDRLWQTKWCFHLCVGGKGYYNGKLISRGDCFLSWPFFKHSIIADPDDPLEFYWLILRGDKLNEFINDNGFRHTKSIFKTRYVDQLTALFELGMNSNYSDIDIHKYTMGLADMIFSFLGQSGEDDEYSDQKMYGISYSNMARQLLYDNDYSLSVTELAHKIGVSANYLGKVFYKDRGETLKSYIARKRIQTAANFLENGMTPTDVFRTVGYKNYSAFYSAFVDKYGVSPSQFAKNSTDTESDNSRN